MKEILKKLFRKDHYSVPPSSIRRKFKEIFPGAINEEWLEEENLWEVVFHDDQKEKIARINQNGKVVECRINMILDDIPGEILKMVNEKGEIMNAIFIDKPEGKSWEIIYRDKKLDRYLLVVNPEGQEMSNHPL